MDNKLPHFTRERLLGEGGMGKVYLAQDNQLQRKVAIKELTYLSESQTKTQAKSQAKDEKISHALQEARLLARVSHTNIVQIYNIHNEGSYTALVMEYFKSKTLAQYQKETSLTLNKKIDLLRQLSAGLSAAHSEGVIHCDLKPSNILVNEQGLLKITDFGIAYFMKADAKNKQQNETQTSISYNPDSVTEPINYGCLFYMSPEQIKQQAIDYRSDIFSLGIIAYQLIVGSHPFACGNNKNLGLASEVADRICEQTPEHAKNLVPDAPSALTNLLMEMLAKPIEQRTLTAGEIENRLKLIQNAIQQSQLNEQPTLPLTNSIDSGAQSVATVPKWRISVAKVFSSLCFLCVVTVLTLWFVSTDQIKAKQVVILKPTLAKNSLMAAMQQDLVISAVEDALRQAVINTKDMYLVSQREVNAITKEYPDDLKKLKQAVGASDIISTELECDNSRCKITFSRLVANPNKNEMLSVKYEESWLTHTEKFNAIYSTSQTQFASLFPEHPEVNQGGLVQRAINEEDYKSYIALYSQIKGHGNYSVEELNELKAILTSSPYLYAVYGLYRDTALDLHIDSQDKSYLNQLDNLLLNSPPEYRYSAYEAIDRFMLALNMREFGLAKEQIIEAEHRGADELIITELRAYLYFSLGEYKKAADAYSSAHMLRPSSTLLNNIAFSYWRLGDLEEAKFAVDKVLKIVPNNAKAKRLRANIWLLQGKLSLAIIAYDKLVEDYNRGQDLTNLSLAYALNNEFEKSLEYAKSAVNKNPENAIRLLNLADIELILGRGSSAEVIYKKIIDSPANINIHRYWQDLAQAYVHLGEHNLAIEALNNAKKIAPENGEVAYTAALVYSILGEKTSAIFEVKKALSNRVGAVWFNLPWFDNLCVEYQFQQLMAKHSNSSRCSSSI